MKQKRGQTEIIVTVLLVLIALSAVATMGYFIINTVKENTQTAEAMSKISNVEIKEAKVYSSALGNVVKVKISNGGKEVISAVKIVTSDGTNTKVFTTNESIAPLETREFIFNVGTMNVSSVEMYPIVNVGSTPVTGNKADVEPAKQTGETIVDSGLVSYWSFDNGANDTLGRNNGSCSGVMCPTSIAGKKGNAYNFNNGNNSLNLGSSSTLKPSTLTLALWINFAGKVGYNSYFFSKPVGYSPWLEYGLYIAPTSKKLIAFMYNGTSYCSLASSAAITTNSWQHSVFTYDGKVAALYLNGSIQANTTGCAGGLSYNSAVIFPYQSVFLGSWSATSNPENFNGTIDEVRIFNRSLSVEEVKTLYDLGG